MKSAVGHLLGVWALTSPSTLAHVGTLVTFALIQMIYQEHRRCSGGEVGRLGVAIPPMAERVGARISELSAPPEQYKEAR
jgi:hypothetical protein